MMDENMFTQAMTILGVSYNKEFTSEQVGIWYQFFKNENIDDFKIAIQRIITKNKFLPSVAEVKQEIALISNPILQLNADQEWDKVLNAVKVYGSYRETDAMASLEPFTRNIVRQIDFQRICQSTDIQWEKREFTQLFSNCRERDEMSLMLDEPQMTLPELLRMAEIKKDNTLLIEE